ncbi:hypothetical protein [Actinomadura rubrisoli]|uniref:Uncharacterized protein n=1 Tax=Actinomadura rubrisoli TaxID=2530368 RepID=A0A4R5CBX3_9ACTN|nr:hypothetical protein [Actinomadura rubrisoli]TDD94634.1 hypothetical protein E1298_06530 [Actinomadura rubrisoli]
MGREQQEWRLRVLTDGDTLRQERLTRDLLAELRRAEALEAGFSEEAEAAAPSGGARKGGQAGELALWAIAAAGSGQASRVLVTLIKEWSARARQRKVEIKSDAGSITITGSPDEAQERLVLAFLDRHDGGSGTE